MNPKVKKLWVEALRSGKYEQGYNGLRTNDNKFCCLGVLCDIHRKTMKKKGWRLDGLPDTYFYGDSCGSLPSNVIEWSGVDNYNPTIKGNSLIFWNDNIRYSFDKIADLIEKEL